VFPPTIRNPLAIKVPKKPKWKKPNIENKTKSRPTPTSINFSCCFCCFFVLRFFARFFCAISIPLFIFPYYNEKRRRTKVFL